MTKLSTAGIIISLIVAVLLWVIFRSCNNNSNTVDKKSFDSLIVAKMVSEKESGKVIDSVMKELNHRHVKEDSLAKVTSKLGDQLELKNLTVRALAKEVQLYATYKDTVELLRAAPLLADEVIILSEKVDEYANSNVNLLNSLDSTKGTAAVLILEKDNMYRDLSGRFDYLAGSYSRLDYNYGSMTKKLKREKSLSRVLAIAVLVVGGIALTK